MTKNKLLVIGICLGLIASIWGCSGGLAPEIRSPVYYLYTGTGTNIYGYALDTTTGLLTANPGNPYPSQGLRGMAADSGRNLIITSDSGSNFVLFSANPQTGDLSVVSSLHNSGNSNSVTLDTQLQTVYGDGLSVVFGASYAGGSLAVINGSPFSVYINLGNVQMDVFNRFLFGWGNGTTRTMNISPTGAVSNSSTTGAGCNIATPSGNIVLDITGQYYIVTDANQATFCNYSINQSTGALTGISTFIPGSGASDHITADQTNRFLYSLDGTTPAINVYRFNNNGASFTFLKQNSPAGSPAYFVADPNGHFLYTTDAAAGKIIAYSVDSNGNLTQIQSITIGGTGAIPPFIVKLYK